MAPISPLRTRSERTISTYSGSVMPIWRRKRSNRSRSNPPLPRRPGSCRMISAIVSSAAVSCSSRAWASTSRRATVASTACCMTPRLAAARRSRLAPNCSCIRATRLSNSRLTSCTEMAVPATSATVPPPRGARKTSPMPQIAKLRTRKPNSTLATQPVACLLRESSMQRVPSWWASRDPGRGPRRGARPYGLHPRSATPPALQPVSVPTGLCAGKRRARMLRPRAASRHSDYYDGLPRPIVFGNWKMHGLRAEARALAGALAGHAGDRTGTLGVFPPFTVLAEVAARRGRQGHHGRRPGLPRRGQGRLHRLDQRADAARTPGPAP